MEAADGAASRVEVRLPLCGDVQLPPPSRVSTTSVTHCLAPSLGAPAASRAPAPRRRCHAAPPSRTHARAPDAHSAPRAPTFLLAARLSPLPPRTRTSEPWLTRTSHIAPSRAQARPPPLQLHLIITPRARPSCASPSVASDGRALSIRWRAYEDARLANAIVLALRRKLAPRMSRADDPLNGLAWCC